MSSCPKVWLLRFLCYALLWVGGTAVFAQSTPEEDEFLQLLRSELQQQYDSLQQTNVRPYFMAYRVNETTEHSISANFGKIYDNSTSKSVVLTIEMRVGKPETDNYHYLTYKTPYVKQIPLPLDENPALVRKILRNETREAYQKAVDRYTDNIVAERFLVGDEDVEMFLYMSNDRDGYYATPVDRESHWNETLWIRNLEHSTASTELDLREKSANIRYQSIRKYLVNSEKSYFVKNDENTLLTLRVGGLTLDGVPEHIERQHYTFFPDQLPDGDVLRTEMEEMEMLFSHLVRAEKCGSSSCPVLLSPQASSVLIHNLLGHDLENPNDNYLRNRIGQQILPESFSVYTNPITLASYYKNYHGGSYLYDDEGTMGQSVDHIDHGELRPLMLSSRTQQPDAYESYGNARGNSRLPSPRQSNLFLRSDKPLNDNQLLEALSREAKKQSLEYALYVKEVEVRCDTDDVITLYPTVCYKIYPNHSKQDEMVRDVLLTGSKQQWLNNVLLAGEDADYVAIMCHSQQDDLMTCGSAPALLFGNVEIRPQHKTLHPQRIVRYPTITASNTPMSTTEVFTKSAQQEWETDVEHLKIGDETAPYYEEFLMTDARIFTVEASEGSVFYANEKSVRQFVPRLLLGDDRFNNENVAETVTPPENYPLPFNNYSTFAEEFRDAADAEYQKALKQWKTKQALLPTPESRTLPDRSYAPATQTDDERTFDLPTMHNLQHLACDASAALAKHDGLSRSGVNIYIMLGNAYFWNSEKTTYSRPVSVIGVQIYGALELGQPASEFDKVVEYSDAKTLFFPSVDSLFSSQRIHNEIDIFAKHLQEVRDKRYQSHVLYVGPILIEGEAVGQILASVLLEGTPNLLAHRESLMSAKANEQSFENQLDKVITSKKISVTANKSGDQFDKSAFVRYEKTDAEGVETQETEIIRNGELIALMGNRNVTKSTPYSNGFQQLAIHNEGCFATRGASRIDFTHKATVSHKKLKQQLFKEAKNQGYSYAYIIRQVYNADMRNVIKGKSAPYMQLMQCYLVNVHTGEEIPIVDARMLSPNFDLLQNILYVSDKQEAFPIMMRVPGATGTRDFPFAGVPTCIVAPNVILLKQGMVVN